MSIKITLFVDDLEFNVLDYFFDFFQNSDYTGRPSNKPNSYPFKLTLEARKDNTFFEWAIHPTMQKRSVKIVFSPVNGMSKSTTIELLDVHCLLCQYHFTATGSQPFVENIELSPATIMRDGQVLMKKYWAVTDPAMLNQKSTLVGEEKEPMFNSIEYFDSEENEIEETRFTDISKIKVGVSNIDDGETIEILMHRENGEGVAENQKEVAFSGTVDNGYAVLEEVEMKRDWEIINENNEETD